MKGVTHEDCALAMPYARPPAFLANLMCTCRPWHACCNLCCATRQTPNHASTGGADFLPLHRAPSRTVHRTGFTGCLACHAHGLRNLVQPNYAPARQPSGPTLHRKTSGHGLTKAHAEGPWSRHLWRKPRPTRVLGLGTCQAPAATDPFGRPARLPCSGLAGSFTAIGTLANPRYLSRRGEKG